MTPALKAMVDAMVAELGEQAGNQLGAGHVENPDGQLGVYLEGVFDLEKVARAGLEAINRPPLASLAAAWRTLGSEDECEVPVRDIYEAMIDAILKEAP